MLEPGAKTLQNCLQINAVAAQAQVSWPEQEPTVRTINLKVPKKLKTLNIQMSSILSEHVHGICLNLFSITQCIPMACYMTCKIAP